MKKLLSMLAIGAMLTLSACDDDEPEPVNPVTPETGAGKASWVLSRIFSEDDNYSQIFTYDSLGRLTGMSYSDGTNTTYKYNSQSICRDSYDDYDVFTLSNGRVASANIFDSGFTYNYTSAGRLESIFTSDSWRSKKFRFNWQATSLTSLSVNEDYEGTLQNYTIEFTPNTLSSEIHPDCIRWINAHMLATFTEAIDMYLAQSGVFGEMPSELIYSAIERGGENSGWGIRFSCGNIDSNRCPRTLTVTTTDGDSPSTIQLTWKQL